LKVIISTNINKGNNYLLPKINEQHKKERRKDMPWDRPVNDIGNLPDFRQ
jgi:hypothetical protein